MHYDPALDNHGLAFNPFKSLVGPRPIAWISTVSKDGIDNLAPFSQFQNLSYDPPLVMIAINQTGMEEDNIHRKDTVNNIEATGEFVYNMVPYAVKEKMNLTAVPHEPSVDEFQVAGLTKLDSLKVKPKRVAESPIQFECEYLQTIRFRGVNPKGTCDMIIGRVLEIHIADEYILPNGKIDILKIRPLARLGYFDFTTVDSSFSMPVPVSDPRILHAFEGKPLNSMK